MKKHGSLSVNRSVLIAVSENMLCMDVCGCGIGNFWDQRKKFTVSDSGFKSLSAMIFKALQGDSRSSKEIQGASRRFKAHRCLLNQKHHHFPKVSADLMPQTPVEENKLFAFP